jgi:hypothetical protein
MRPLLFALALGFSPPAEAVSRLVFQLSGPMTVRLDGQDVPNAGGRAVANGIGPGDHEVYIASPSGSSRTTRIQVDDGQSVTIVVGADGALQVRGMGARVLSGGSGAIEGSSSVAAAAAQTDPKQAEAGPGSFDLNEGQTRSAPKTDNSLDREYQAFARGVSTVGRTAGSVVAPGATAIAGAAAPAVSRGAGAVVGSARAGGVRDLRSGSGQGRQGTARAPKTITGTVNIETAANDGYVVYVGGMEVARVAGGSQGSAKVPVGRQPVELWDADTNAVRWRGVLEVLEDQPITVRVSDSAPPQAVERSWAWSNR